MAKTNDRWHNHVLIRSSRMITKFELNESPTRALKIVSWESFTPFLFLAFTLTFFAEKRDFD